MAAAYLRSAAKSLAGALFARAGEHTARHIGGGLVERLAVVSGDLRVGNDPWSGRERVGVMFEALHGLAAVGDGSPRGGTA